MKRSWRRVVRLCGIRRGLMHCDRWLGITMEPLCGGSVGYWIHEAVHHLTVFSIFVENTVYVYNGIIRRSTWDFTNVYQMEKCTWFTVISTFGLLSYTIRQELSKVLSTMLLLWDDNSPLISLAPERCTLVEPTYLVYHWDAPRGCMSG